MLRSAATVQTWITNVPCRGQGLQSRPVWSNRCPPVAVYRTGLTENRWKLVEFKSKFKIACVNGSDQYTDRFDRFTGRFTGVLTKKSDGVKVVPRFDRFTGRFDRFTGRFDRFTNCHMWWVLMGRPIFSFSFLI